MKKQRAIFFAILAALLYALSTPISKIILNELHPVFKDENVKLELKKSQHVLLEQIAVDKEMTGTGIGSLLIQDFIQKANQPILSFVAVEPFNNDTSIKFHEANHFIHVGDFSRDVFMDRENYVSYLYMFER